MFIDRHGPNPYASRLVLKHTFMEKTIREHHLAINALNRRPSPTRAIVTAIVACAAIVLTLALVQVAPLVAPLAAIFLGTRYRYVANLVHWASHRSACDDLKINDRIGSLLAPVIFQSFGSWRRDHASHHASLGNYDADREFGPLRELDMHSSIGIESRAKQMVSMKTWALYVSRPGFQEAGQSVGTILHFLLALGLLASGAYVALATWLCGLFVFYPMVRYLTDLVDHGGIYEQRGTRNCVVKNRFVRMFTHPGEDCFHKLHHDYPSVSAQSQEAVHGYLLTIEAEYARLIHSASSHVTGWMQLPAKST